MIKKLTYFPPDRKGDGVTFKTGENNVVDIFLETDSVVVIAFDDGSFTKTNMPYEFSVIKEAELA